MFWSIIHIDTNDTATGERLIHYCPNVCLCINYWYCMYLLFIAPGVVSNLTVTDITYSSMKTSWKKPKNPNGDIYAYIILVNKDDQCKQKTVLRCVDCGNMVVSSVVFFYGLVFEVLGNLHLLSCDNLNSGLMHSALHLLLSYYNCSSID